MVGARGYDWRLEKAERFLHAADHALAADNWEAALSRAYYAVYHAVITLLEAKAGVVRRRWDHTELQNEFRARFAQRGFLFSAADALRLVALHHARLDADYERKTFRRSEVERLLEQARDLHRRVIEVIANG